VVSKVSSNNSIFGLHSLHLFAHAWGVDGQD